MPDSAPKAPRHALPIETFDNRIGGDALFRAIGHPLARPQALALVAELEKAGRVAVYDPFGAFATLSALYDFSRVEIAGLYGRDHRHLGAQVGGRTVHSIKTIAAAKADTILVAAFDADLLVAQAASFLPADATVKTLDLLRIPERLLTDPKRYLSTYNFVTNLVLFRDSDVRHTRMVTANYWYGYGARNVRAWLLLLDADGKEIASWEEALPDAVAAFTVDSREVRKRFKLSDFDGQLFVHMVGIAGHDVLKYALDSFGPEELSCTHDANPWPADFYAGIPAPAPGERVRVWVQNCQPCPIPVDGVRFAAMGSEAWAPIGVSIPAFGMREIDMGDLLPALAWPQQIEMDAGKYVVRPRYEVIRPGGKRHIAHANVERTDLGGDPEIASLATHFGKGFILSAPILPQDTYTSFALPTPMARGQASLPLIARFYDADGSAAGERFLGNLPRSHAHLVDLGQAKLKSGYGHARCTGTRRRNELRQPHLQYPARVQKRAAILYRPPAGPVDAAVPASGQRRLRIDVPSRVSGLDAVARKVRHAPRTLRRGRHQTCGCKTRDRVLGLAFVAPERILRRGRTCARGRRRLRVDPRPHLPPVRLSWPRGRRRTLLPRPYVRVLTAAFRQIVDKSNHLVDDVT